MKFHKNVIYTIIIIAIIIIIATTITLAILYNQKRIRTELLYKNITEYHMNLSLLNNENEFEEIQADASVEKKALNYKKDGITYLYHLGADVLSFLQYDAPTQLWLYYDHENAVLEKSDISTIYSIFQKKLAMEVAKNIERKMTIEFSVDDTIDLNNIFNILTENDFDYQDNWQCTYDIQDDFIKAVSCKEKNKEIVKIEFSNINNLMNNIIFTKSEIGQK